MKVKFKVTKNVFEDIKFLEVSAGVRYWEDATVNGVEDKDGTLIPFRNKDNWTPIIDIEKGIVLDWPESMNAQIHYKVCDAGEYWLLDENKTRIAKWSGYYVPNRFLCHGDNGYGDYIIMNIAPGGKIIGYSVPVIDGVGEGEDGVPDWNFI